MNLKIQIGRMQDPMEVTSTTSFVSRRWILALFMHILIGGVRRRMYLIPSHPKVSWLIRTREWTNKWIADHGIAQQKVNKPVLFEEYGWLHADDKLAWLGVTAPANETRVAVVGEWQKISLDYKMSDMYWQLGVCGLSTGCSTVSSCTIGCLWRDSLIFPRMTDSQSI
jgi:hypothetical protein